MRSGFSLTMPAAILVPAAALALLMSAAAALAQGQVGGADATPYPVEADAVAHAAHSPTHHIPAKPHAQAAATPAIATGAPMPRPRPEALKATANATVTATLKPAAVDSKANTDDGLAGIAPGERQRIQAALIWAGDATGASDGEDPLLTAVKNFQKRKKHKVTGTLSADERQELVAAAKDYEDEFGWSVVADPATGIRIGLPTKMVPQVHEAPRGTRWSSRHGEVQIETFRYTDPALALATLFEQEKQEPSTRKVEYSVLRDDSFFISGLQGLKKFSVRAQLRNGEVRGFTMLFDQAMEGIVTPVMVAMAAAFSPFPQHPAPFAALSKSVEYGNGLIVSDEGHIVTDARLTRGCQVLVAPGLGDAERIADDSERGLALLRVYGPRQWSPLKLPHATAKTGDITLTGIPDPKDGDGRSQIAAIKARLGDGNAIELRQPVPMAGFTGAAAIDGDGRFVGLTEMRNAVLASIQPSAPPVRLIRAETIRKFLDAHHVAMPQSGGSNPRDAVVRIICVRK